MNNKIPLTFACGPTDRMLPLYMQEVSPSGINLTFLPFHHPRDVFDRMTGNPPAFDCSEFSTSEYITRYCAGERKFIAIPVFPSRTFRHSFICINTKHVRPNHPEDLAGKKIGVQLYTMTAAVWQRGHLEDMGVDLSGVQWVQGAMETAAVHGNPNVLQTIAEDKRPNLVVNTSGKSLSDLLADGDIAATIGSDLPTCLGKAPDVCRLWPDFKEVEKQYFKDTGIFPIMHSVVFQKSFVEKHPFAPISMYNTFCDSKDIAVKRMRFLCALPYMLPWMPNELDEIDEVFGGGPGKEGDPFIYGLEENRKTIEALVRHLYDQGMIDRKPTIEELFLPTKRDFMSQIG